MWDAQKATVKGNPTIQQQNNKQLNLNMIKRIEQAFLQRRNIDGQFFWSYLSWVVCYFVAE